MKTNVLPSILSADFCKMGEEIKMIESIGADMIHCDVMDGTFVNPITFGAQMVKEIRKHTLLPLDVHLMIMHPETQVENFAKAGADYITVHYEAYERENPETASERITACLKLIRDNGVKCGLVINPATEAEVLKPFLPYVDLILIMSVVPGYGGQKFMAEVLPKVVKVREWEKEMGLSIDVEIDGGVTEENASLIREAGVNLLVAGNTVFKSPDRAKTVKVLRGDV